MTAFHLHDHVTWTSTSGGTSKTKTGQIVAVIPAGDTLRKHTGHLESVNRTLWLLEEYSPPRDHETYVIKVGRKFYRPHVKHLLPYQNSPLLAKLREFNTSDVWYITAKHSRIDAHWNAFSSSDEALQYIRHLAKGHGPYGVQLVRTIAYEIVT